MSFKGKQFLALTIEFGPIIGFLISSTFVSFITAASIFVVTTILALIIAQSTQGRLALFPLIAGFSVMLGGGATVLYQDSFWLILKDTLYNGAFFLVISGGLLVNKLPLQSLFGSLFHMSDTGWRILSYRWATMFGLLALSNYLVGAYTSEQTWLMYKFGATLVTTMFALYQFTISRKHRLPGSNVWGMVV